MSIGEKIRALREKKGMTMAELSRKLFGKECRQRINDWETDRRIPTVKSLQQIALLLCGSAEEVSWLFGANKESFADQEKANKK